MKRHCLVLSASERWEYPEDVFTSVLRLSAIISSSLGVARPFTNGIEWGWNRCTDPMVGGARSITLYDTCTPPSALIRVNWIVKWRSIPLVVVTSASQSGQRRGGVYAKTSRSYFWTIITKTRQVLTPLSVNVHLSCTRPFSRVVPVQKRLVRVTIKPSYWLPEPTSRF